MASGTGDGEGEGAEASDHDALDAFGRPLGIELDMPNALEQPLEDSVRFQAGERSTDAEVDTTTEADVVTRSRPIEDDFVGRCPAS